MQMKNTGKKLIVTFAIGALTAGTLWTMPAATTMAAVSTETETTAEAGDSRKGRGGHGGQMNSEWISQLVTDGILDQDTADSLVAYQTQKAAERKAQADSMAEITKEERQASREALKDSERPEPFAEAVTDGILTQDQADAIKAAMPQKSTSEDGTARVAKSVQNFSSLVESGIIDQTTADNMKAYIEQKHAAAADTTSDGARTKSDRPDMYASMVTDGIITQEQADAIKAAMPQRKAMTNSES